MSSDLPGRLPLISEAMCVALEQLFPDTVPSPADPERDIWRKVGNVEVVRFIRDEFNNQLAK